MDPKEAISKVSTLSDVEGLCVSFAGIYNSSDPVLAVKVIVPGMMSSLELALPDTIFLFLLRTFHFNQYGFLCILVFSCVCKILKPLPVIKTFLLVQEYLKEEPYTAEEIEAVTGEKLTSFLNNNAAYLEVLKVAKQYKLHQVISLSFISEVTAICITITRSEYIIYCQFG